MNHRLVPPFIVLLVAGLTVTGASAQSVGTCTTGNADASLYVNNVRAQIYNNGNLFWGGNNPLYEVPKGSGVQSIFSAGLWVGGMAGGQLRMAGSMYGPYEFFPGPLNANGTLPDPNDCSAYDRIYEVTRLEIIQYDDGDDASDNLLNWPWELGAPVVDGDGNPGNYNLAGGDRPAILGHQTQWWVMNDLGGPHTRTGSAPLGMEVQAAAFGAVTGDTPAIDNTTLYRYTFVYKGQAPLEDAYVGLFVDSDLGNFVDDYIGADPDLGLGYTYNADNADEGAFGYGVAPPALGVSVVQGPLANDDGLDNDHDGTTDEADETLGLTHFMTFMNAGGVQGNPSSAEDLYNHLQAQWLDGEPVTEGGDGRSFSDTPTNYFYPGDPVNGEFWSQVNLDGQGASGDPTDTRFLVSVGPFDMEPGESQTVTLAIVWARGSDHLDAITQLRAATQTVQEAWDDGFDFEFSVQPPTRAPALVSPANGVAGQPTGLTLHWEALGGISGYQIEVATDSGFSDVIASESTPGIPMLDVEELDNETTYFWRVRPESPGGTGPWSVASSFTTASVSLDDPGPLLLSDGTPAFVEVAGPAGADPCGAGAGSTFGCSEVGGNDVYGSLNSTGDFAMYYLGPVGPEDRLGLFAPNDYEIRFTAEGSYAAYLFSSNTVVHVPFEVWDIGPTLSGTTNDPADDRRLIPVLFGDNGGECGFGYGEVAGDANPLGLDWAGTDRIYAYYPLTSYGDWDAAAGPMVEADPQHCPEFSDAYGLIDVERDRPIQRITFFGNDTGANYRPEGPPEGTVIRLLTSEQMPAPILAAPADGSTDLIQPVTLWWNTQNEPKMHIQVSTTSDFASLVFDRQGVLGDHTALGSLDGGSYYWRVRRVNRAGTASAWSEPWQFSLSASKVVGNEAEGEVPGVYVLEPNYPNPFNPTTAIRFSLPQAGSVALRVFDMLGRQITTLVDDALPAGWHTVTWDAHGVSSGIYLYHLQAGSFQASRRMTVIK